MNEVGNQISSERLLTEFFDYLRDNEAIEPILRLKIIRHVEILLDQGMVRVLFDAFFDSTRNFVRTLRPKDFGTESDVEFFEIWLRTLMAKDKLMFYRCGLIKPVKPGDLRSVRIVEDEREQLFAMIKLERARKHPGIIAMMLQEAAKMDPGFFLRFGRALKQPAKDFDHLEASPLQRFLLRWWATEISSEKRSVAAPLSYFSDPAIAQLYSLNGQSLSENLVRQTWRRLGLKKPSHIQYWSVLRERGKIIIREF